MAAGRRRHAHAGSRASRRPARPPESTRARARLSQERAAPSNDGHCWELALRARRSSRRSPPAIGSRGDETQLQQPVPGRCASIRLRVALFTGDDVRREAKRETPSIVTGWQGRMRVSRGMATAADQDIYVMGVGVRQSPLRLRLRSGARAQPALVPRRDADRVGGTDSIWGAQSS